MTLPTAQDLYKVIDATWPAATRRRAGRWIIREGQGGGGRVSAASLADGPADEADIAEAEAAMAALGQVPLFMIRDGEAALDGLLDRLGYAVKDPVTLYAAPVTAIAAAPPRVTCFEIWPPLAVQEEIWARGGIGPGRLAVMHRAADPKTSIFGRVDDKPAATGFVAIHDGIAMLHALETLPEHRRKGLARHMVRAMAHWSQSRGAHTISLVTTRANQAANTLYASMGFQPVGQYHYRIRPEAK